MPWGSSEHGSGNWIAIVAKRGYRLCDQSKLSANIYVGHQEFKVVDQFGTYIIQPQNDIFPELPKNEDLTMRMAKTVACPIL